MNWCLFGDHYFDLGSCTVCGMRQPRYRVEGLRDGCHPKHAYAHTWLGACFWAVLWCPWREVWIDDNLTGRRQRW